jgi:hypothetical protein
MWPKREGVTAALALARPLRHRRFGRARLPVAVESVMFPYTEMTVSQRLGAGMEMQPMITPGRGSRGVCGWRPNSIPVVERAFRRFRRANERERPRREARVRTLPPEI